MRSTLEAYAYPVIGKMRVSDIETAHVLDILRPIWSEKTTTAKKLRSWIESILDFAKVQKWRSGENPASWKGNIAHSLPKPSRVKPVEHHASAPFKEAPAIMAELLTQNSIGARALAFGILTCGRSGEIRHATWGEIDIDQAAWVIPGSRMKARKEHRVPLSPLALVILRKMVPGAPDALVFPGFKHRPLTDTALKSVLRRMSRSDITVHGFRSTFRDWAAERTNFPTEVAEMALAHAVGSKVEAAYRRGDMFDKRRRLMDAWCEFCNKPLATGAVVPLHSIK